MSTYLRLDSTCCCICRCFSACWYKISLVCFFPKDSGLRPKEPPKNMLLAMVLLSFLCVLFGIFPNLLYQLLPFDKLYIPYTSDHVIFQLQLLLFAGLAFFVMLPWLKRTLTITLDFDWFYRVGLINF